MATFAENDSTQEQRCRGGCSIGADCDPLATSPESDNRVCRFCLQSEKDMNISCGTLVAPCKCNGTGRWVHTKCLAAWLKAVVERGGDGTRCELCRQPYDLNSESVRSCILQASETQTWRFDQTIRDRLVPLASLFAASTIAARTLLGPSFTSYMVGIGVVFIYYTARGRERDNGDLIFAVLICSVVFFAYWRVSTIAIGLAVPELRPGIVLRFNHPVGGGAFADSIVLLVDYSYNFGAKGYIINKPGGVLSANPFGRADAQLSRSSNFRTGYGGPVSSGGVWEIIHWCHGANVVGQSVESGVPNVRVGGNREDILNALLDTSGAQPSFCDGFHAIVVRGYAGWAPYQLDGEIRRGDWTIHNVTAKLLFRMSPSEMYRAVSKLPVEGAWGLSQMQKQH